MRNNLQKYIQIFLVFLFFELLSLFTTYIYAYFSFIPFLFGLFVFYTSINLLFTFLISINLKRKKLIVYLALFFALFFITAVNSFSIVWNRTIGRQCESSYQCVDIYPFGSINSIAIKGYTIFYQDRTDSGAVCINHRCTSLRQGEANNIHDCNYLLPGPNTDKCYKQNVLNVEDIESCQEILTMKIRQECTQIFTK